MNTHEYLKKTHGAKSGRHPDEGRRKYLETVRIGSGSFMICSIVNDRGWRVGYEYMTEEGDFFYKHLN